MRILKKFLRILAILLPIFCVFFISSDSYAETQTVTYYSGDYIYNNFGFDFSLFNSTPLYFSWSCDINDSTVTVDSSFGVRVMSNYGSSFRISCFQSYNNNFLVRVSSGTLALDYVPDRLGAYSNQYVGSYIDSFTFTISDTPPGSGSVPSGSITLTENGTYDVTSYAEAVVDVPAEQLPGDYDDEFNGVITAIYICGASAIMIYFFYIIYGIFIKPTGGQR